MVDDTKVFDLAEPTIKRPFIGANSRGLDKKMLFPEIGTTMELLCKGIESFVKDDELKPLLVLEASDGTEYVRALGKTNQQQLRPFGLKTANECVGKVIVFEMYETGSAAPFDVGLAIVDVREPSKK